MLLEIVCRVVDDVQAQALTDAARSDAYWMTHEFGVERDEAGLFCERNVLRYRPAPDIEVRVGLGTSAYELARTLLALRALHADAEVSVHPDAEIGASAAPVRTFVLTAREDLEMARQARPLL